ncbi:MAG: polysaccharide deacetylase family protein [Chitinophagaceae bacterium]
MRILHIFSGNVFTGAVEHVAELAEQQRLNGDTVWLMADAGQEHRAGNYIQQPISNRNYYVRLKNILAIRNQIRDLKPDVIHAHSRAASWVAKRACQDSKIALISTVHGRQHIHYSSKKFNDYGDEIIAISQGVRDHLVEELNKNPLRIHVIPNALTYSKEILPLPINPVLSLIGRLNGPKGKEAVRLMREVFPELLSAHPELDIVLVGDVASQEDGNSAWAILEQNFPGRVTKAGFVDDIQAYVDASSVVIGAGRVALRALASGRPVLALGETEFCGLVTIENFDQALISNFGDNGPTETWEASEVIAAFNLALTATGDQELLASKVRNSFSLAEKCAEIKVIYLKARMRKLVPDWLPVLMYHKVPKKPIDSPHRIFVTRENFQRHMNLLRIFNRTPVTFEDYFALRNGEMSLEQWPKNPVVLTFDDGYLDNLTNALPILKAKGWKATLFALVDRTQKENFWDEAERGLETSRLMDAEDLQKMRNEGWEIGAHTYTHKHLPELINEELKHEISDGKHDLEAELKTQILGFAYPYGDFGMRDENMVRDAGYAYAVATDSGALHQEDNLFRIFRVNIFPEEGFFSFWKKTSRWYRKYYFKKRGR